MYRPTLKRCRWKLFSAVSVVGVAIVLLFLYFYEPLFRTCKGVKPGVRFQGEMVERMFRWEVADLVAARALLVGRRPVDAVLDEVSGGIIPELNGLEVDREATEELIMSAERDTDVAPVYREIPPALMWSQYPERPAYRGNSRKPYISLMINVAWGGEYLEEMMAVLEKGAARGTFFLSGCWAEKNHDLVRRIKSGGHERASHGYSDAEVFSQLDVPGMSKSIRKTNEIIFEITGEYPRYFTPHKGEFNELTLEVVARHDMRTVLWTLDTVDWQKPGVDKMMARVAGRFEHGSIILMHPTADTVEFLKRLIPAADNKGFKIVTVAELLSPSLYKPFLGDDYGNTQ